MAYQRAPLLGGITLDIAMLIFSVFFLLFSLAAFMFLGGIRDFLWQGLGQGGLDLVLTKPVHPQLFVSIRRPDLNQCFLGIVILGLFFHQTWVLRAQITPLNWLWFLALFAIGILLYYLSISTLASFGFFVVRAQQVFELFDKATDFAFYPHQIFPGAVQLAMFTVLPVAFFAYIPSMFLLGRGENWMAIGAVVVVIISAVINQWLWRVGLRHYSSASS
jgi:ABC-2 type transport system permease protein